MSRSNTIIALPKACYCRKNLNFFNIFYELLDIGIFFCNSAAWLLNDKFLSISLCRFYHSDYFDYLVLFQKYAHRNVKDTCVIWSAFGKFPTVHLYLPSLPELT